MTEAAVRISWKRPNGEGVVLKPIMIPDWEADLSTIRISIHLRDEP